MLKAVGTSCGRSPDRVVERLVPKMPVAPVEPFSPAGLKVLLVDDDPVCLKIIKETLVACEYSVTSCSKATEALALLMENKSAFDLVLSDVHMPDMDGFKLLENIGLEMDLPVIMMSADSSPQVVLKGINHGACDYLLKPIRKQELLNIWQHVVRRRGKDSVNQDHSGDTWEDHGRTESPSDGDSNIRKRKATEEPLEDVNSHKKARVVWSMELHHQFVAAVNQLTLEKAVPKRILELMAVQGLSRENVASHLQKYRQYLKRLTGVHPQPHPVASFQASQPGNFGGSMQIQPGGRGVAAASCGRGLNVTAQGLGVPAASLNVPATVSFSQMSINQDQAGLIAPLMLNGQLSCGVGHSLGTTPPNVPNVPFVGMPAVSSFDIEALMKSTQQEFAPLQEAGTSYPSRQEAGTNYTPRQEAGTSYPPRQEAGAGYVPRQEAGTSYPPRQSARAGYAPRQEAGTSYTSRQSGRTSYDPRQESGANYSSHQESGANYSSRQESGANYVSHQDAGTIQDIVGLGQVRLNLASQFGVGNFKQEESMEASSFDSFSVDGSVDFAQSAFTSNLRRTSLDNHYGNGVGNFSSLSDSMFSSPEISTGMLGQPPYVPYTGEEYRHGK